MAEQDERKKRKKIVFLLALILFLIVFFASFFDVFNLSGFATYQVEKENKIYVETLFQNSINISFNQSGVKLIEVSGYFEGEGNAKIYAVSSNGNKLLVYSVKKDSYSNSFITGKVTDDINISNKTSNESNNVSEEINITEESIIIDENISINDSETINETINDSIDINLSQNESINLTEDLNISNASINFIENISEQINESNQTGIEDNVSVPEINETLNETIIGKITFENECLETCDLLPNNFTKLIIEVNDGKLYLDYLHLKQSVIPNFKQILNFENISLQINETTQLDLSTYFEGEGIFFDASSSEGYSYEVNGNEVSFEAIKEGEWPIKIYALKDNLLVESEQFYILVSSEIVDTNLTNQSVNETELLNLLGEDLLQRLNAGESVRVMIKPDKKIKSVKVDDKTKIKDYVKNIDEKKLDKTKFNDKKILEGNFVDAIVLEQESDDFQAITVDKNQIIDLISNEIINEIKIDEIFSAFITNSINLTKINEVKNEGYSGKNVSICILDSGFNYDLFGYNLNENIFGYNFINDSDNFLDDNGHGTLITYPITQVAPDSKLIIAKVIGSDGVGYASDVLAGLEYCESQNVDIISISIGGGNFDGYCDEDPVAQKTNSIVINNSTFVVAATGNGGNLFVKSPACARNVVQVASSSKTDYLSLFSNYNGATLLLAPGQNILTKNNQGTEELSSGTSMSVPFVSGTAALLLENESMNPEELKWRIIHSGEIINKTITKEIVIEQNNSNETINNTFIRQFSRLNAYNAINNIITNNLEENNNILSYGQAQIFSTSSSMGYNNPGNTFEDASIGDIRWSNVEYANDLDDTWAITQDSFDPSSSSDVSVKLIVSGTITGTDQATSTIMSGDETGYYFGSSTNTWGTSLTPGIVNANNFGVVIAFGDEMSATSRYLGGNTYGFNIPAGATITGVMLYTEYFIDEKGSYQIYVDGLQLIVYYTEAISPRGTPYSWSWQNLTSESSGVVISGTPYSWSWQNQQAGSGRMIKQGTPYSWVWGTE